MILCSLPWVGVKRLNEIRPLRKRNPHSAEGLDNTKTNFPFPVFFCCRRLTESCLRFRHWLVRMRAAFTRQFGMHDISFYENMGLYGPASMQNRGGNRSLIWSIDRPADKALLRPDI